MKTYSVTITETLQKTVEVEANSREQAEGMVHVQWDNSEHVLDSDNFKAVSFEAKTMQKNIDYER
jgi:hypothetical protein